ncbi:MAG TPA: OmpA family protein [Solirubrobacteraceae bacterium]|nr:OmpA family protein [Solirubrobacteraceae bacterium]
MRWAAVCIAVVVALAGCGGSSHKHSTTTADKTKTKTSATNRPAPAAKPIAVVDDVVVGGLGPEHMRIPIYDLRREGPYVVLDFGIKCLDQTATGCNQELDFAAPSHSGEAVTANANTASGVKLVDPAGHKEYLPVRDSQNRPFDSLIPSLNDSLTHLAWVVFPAPPTSVTSIDVVFPNGGPQVPGIPISASASPPTADATMTAAKAAPFAAALGSSDTTGLTLPIENLVSTVGNPNGSDSESASQDAITLRSDVLFHFAKSNLTSAAHSILGRLAPQIKSRAIGPVKITGYTDSIGTDAVNIPLSNARAHSVVAALQPLTPGVSYESSGKGSNDPVAPNTKPDGSDNPAGRALNRRVTIVFSVKALSPPSPPPASAPAPAGAGTQGRTLNLTVKGGALTAHYQFTVNDLFREGDLVVLRMNLNCLSVTGQETARCDGETDLEGTPTVPPQPQSVVSSEFNSISGFYLRDPATGSEYIPLHDTDGLPLTSGVTTNLKVGADYPQWIYFPAPPSSVSSVTLVAPGGSTSLTDVPIGSSPPAQP